MTATMTEAANQLADSYPTDLQFNYPVLPSQQQRLASILQQTAQASAKLLSHQPYGGCAEHRETAALWLSKEAGLSTTNSVGADRVMLCAGAHHAVYVALLAAGLRGRKIAVDPLTYPGFRMQAASLGIELIPCVSDTLGMTPQTLQDASHAGAAAVFLMPTIHNPLGTVMPLNRRREISHVARAHGLWIIEDDAYRFLDQAPPPTCASLAPDRTFFIWSFTKPFAPAMKLAYLTFPEQFSPEVSTAIRITSSGVSAVLAQMASAMVTDGSLQRIIEAKRIEGARRQQAASAILAGIDIQAHPTSFHLWIDLPLHKNAQAVTNQLQSEGVLINSSHDFAATATVKANGLRVALGAEPEEARRISALERLRASILR